MPETYSKILQASSLSFLVMGMIFFFVGYLLNNQKMAISAVIEKTKGEVAAYSTFLPKDFPKDVFLPLDSDVRTVNKNLNSYFVVFETQESESLLKQKFAGEMKKHGWKIQDNAFIKNSRQVSLDTVLDEDQKSVVGFLKLKN